MTSRCTHVKTPLSEDFLHYVWLTKSFEHENLHCSRGEPIKILNYGIHNHNAGPDFLEAQIMLGNTHWAGSIEIHTQSSLWIKHGHQGDPRYENVILHVVLEEDKPIFHKDGSPIVCLELFDRIPERLVEKAVQLLHTRLWIPCQSNVKQVRPIVMKSWLESVLVERLTSKHNNILKIWESSDYSWEETLYILLSYAFGLKINAEAFHLLAQSIPLKIIQKNQNDAFKLEALIFGQSGILNQNWNDPYPKKLRKEYNYLKKLYKLSPIPKNLWRFHRLRPSNFPSLRLAQYARFLSAFANQFMNFLDLNDIQEFYKVFDLDIPEYWQNHYLFDKESNRRIKRIGKSFIEQVLINAVIPFLFSYGKERNIEKYSVKAIHLLTLLKAEKNNISNTFKTLGFTCDTALESQALIQLKHNYCDQKSCLSCAIGHEILK